jgi:hypothetical protein
MHGSVKVHEKLCEVGASRGREKASSPWRATGSNQVGCEGVLLDAGETLVFCKTMPDFFSKALRIIDQKGKLFGSPLRSKLGPNDLNALADISMFICDSFLHPFC